MKCVSIRHFIAGIAVLSLSACFSERDVPLAGTEWRVESIGRNTQPFGDGKATIAFSDEGRISAYAGCNRMGGSYSIKGRVLVISHMMSTRMACVPQQTVLDEQALAEALAKTTNAEVTQDKATLSGADGVAIVLWRETN